MRSPGLNAREARVRGALLKHEQSEIRFRGGNLDQAQGREKPRNHHSENQTPYGIRSTLTAKGASFSSRSFIWLLRGSSSPVASSTVKHSAF
jgi:hypothetical protein